jgi:hypothetical protein
VLKSSKLMCKKFVNLGQMSLVALQVHWLQPFYLNLTSWHCDFEPKKFIFRLLSKQVIKL